MKNTKWNLIIDVARCENCNNCVIAAKDEYVGNEHKGYSAPMAKNSAEIIAIDRNVRGSPPVIDTAYLERLCYHCDDAPCMKVGGDAIYKRDDGIVIIDPEKAKGRKDIVKSCPYGAIVWNEEQQLPQSWIFDAHLLDQGWERPRCQQSCPTDVFEAVKTTDAQMQERVAAESLEVLLPHLNTHPRVYYRNLHRFNRCIIGGSVVAVVNGVEDCVEGAQVRVEQNNQIVGIAKTDCYGEFKVDKLVPNSGNYQVIVEHPAFNRLNVEANLGQSIYLGVLTLTATEK